MTAFTALKPTRDFIETMDQMASHDEVEQIEDCLADEPVHTVVDSIEPTLSDLAAHQDIEDDLQEARFPFLRFHLDGNGYGPGRAAFTGSGDLHWVDCDQSGKPAVCVEVVDGKASIDPDSLVLVDDLLAAERAVLHPS